jgi:hypothetical protein
MEIFQSLSVIFLLVAFSATTSLTLYFSIKALSRLKKLNKSFYTTLEDVFELDKNIRDVRHLAESQIDFNRGVYHHLKKNDPKGVYNFNLVNDDPEKPKHFVIGGSDLLLLSPYFRQVFNDEDLGTSRLENSFLTLKQLSEYLGKKNAKFSFRFTSRKDSFQTDEVFYRTISSHPDGRNSLSAKLDIMNCFSAIQFQASVVDVVGGDIQVSEFSAVVITLAPNTSTSVLLFVESHFDSAPTYE